MGDWNMPDGCRVTDIPGYNDVEGEETVECGNEDDLETMCPFKGKVEGVFSDNTFYWTCPICEKEHVIEDFYDPPEPDYDDYDDYDDWRDYE